MLRQMVLFITVMLITFLFFWTNDNKRDKKTGVIIITIIMGCFSGFRSWFMGDLLKYYGLYTSVNGTEASNAFSEKNLNLGIRYFFWIAGHLGFSYDVCIFLISSFSAIALGILVYRYSEGPFWSYLIYIAMGFYVFTFTGLKQTIAMGFVIFAVIGIFENNWKKFYFWVLIAGMFHAPALILLPAYFIAKKEIDWEYGFFLTGFLIIGYIFRNQIVDIFSDAYYESEKMFSANKTIGGRVIVMILIILLGIFLRPARGKNRYTEVLNLMIIAAAIQYFSIYNNVFTRLADYYYQFVILFIPMMLETGDHQLATTEDGEHKIVRFNRDVYVLLSFGIIIFALWFYINSTIADEEAVDQFKFFWEQNEYELLNAK